MPTKRIKHTTDINAPIDEVWNALVRIESWEWNKWTRLEAESAATGTKGKLKASFDGDEKWKTYDFKFIRVSDDDHLLMWGGTVGPGGCLFSGCHHMRLLSIGPKITRLEHGEVFSGLLPAFGLGLPYKKLDKNYLLMNEALKEYVEKGKK